jgi:hypothetical protein
MEKNEQIHITMLVQLASLRSLEDVVKREGVKLLLPDSPLIRRVRGESETQLRQNIQKQSRCRTELLVTLASLPDLDRLTQRERMKLVRLAHNTGFTFVNVLPIWADDGDSQWSVLTRAHAIIRPVLVHLLEEKPVPLQLLAACERSFACLTRFGYVQCVIRNAAHHEELVVELWRLLRQDAPLPLRRCPECKTIFVVFCKRGAPKKYCTPRCTNRATEARRDSDKRREYQCQLMRDRRANGKEPKRSKKKARARAVKSRGTSQGKHGQA